MARRARGRWRWAWAGPALALLVAGAAGCAPAACIFDEVGGRQACQDVLCWGLCEDGWGTCDEVVPLVRCEGAGFDHQCGDVWRSDDRCP